MTEVIPKSDWGHILIEIGAKISQHIESYDDYEAFSEVCSTWWLSIKEYPSQYINKKHTQLPWLMLVDPDDSSYRRYYSLTKCLFRTIPLPPILLPPHNRRYFSSQGWLVSVNRNISKSTNVDHYFNIFIFNPFSKNNVIIEAPLFHVNNQYDVGDWEDDNMLVPLFHKLIISTSPVDKDGDDDFVVAVIVESRKKVAYWRLGHGDTWVVPNSLGLNSNIADLCFFRGELYAIRCYGKYDMVITFGDLNDHENSRKPRMVAHMGGSTHVIQYPADMAGVEYSFYLVESKCDQGTLFFIQRFVFVESYLEPNNYFTSSFNVFKINVDTGKVKHVKSLGNQAIFVGFNSTFGVHACPNVDDDRACKPDCIYYTDDTSEQYFFRNQGGGSDMGIYSLPQGSTLPCYEGVSRFSVINPPTWIEFSSSPSFST